MDTKQVHEGAFHGGLPYLVAGSGPPLVVLSGLSATHTNPTGLDRRVQLRIVEPLTDHFAVHLTGRRPSLEADTTMRDLAEHVAAAIEHHFEVPVPVEGISTGGCIALQLAIDHPHLVEQLVLASTAHRLAPLGRRAQRTLADRTLAGRPRAGWASLGPPTAATRFGGWLMSAVMWLAGSFTDPDDPTDMIVTIAAEDAFDASAELGRITAPTLVICGERDRFYGADLAAATAAAIPNARLVIVPGKGHLGALNHPSAQKAVLEFMLDSNRARRG